MNKCKIAFIVCVVWLIFEPIFMGVEMATSDFSAQGLKIIANVFAKSNRDSKQSSLAPQKDSVDQRSNTFETAKKGNDRSDSILSKINRIIVKNRRIYNKCSQTLGDSFQYPYADINGLFQRILGKRYHSKGFFRQEDDSLVVCKAKTNSDEDKIEDLEEKLKRLQSFLDKEGVKLLYIQRPSKNMTLLPTYEVARDESWYKADKLLSFCKLEEIDYIDLREELAKTQSDWNDAFYKTDLHWKAETGFWAFQIVAKELKERYDFSFDEKIVQETSYQFEPHYENNHFLGSFGSRTGKYFTRSIDSITKIYPKFPTSYSVSILPTTNEIVRMKDVTGNFEEVCLCEKRLCKSELTFELHACRPYGYYNDGQASRRVVNNFATNDKKVLLIRDSFGFVFSPFLYGVCKEFYDLDLRSFHQESLIDYVARVKPDVVILMTNQVFRPDMTFEEKSQMKFDDK